MAEQPCLSQLLGLYRPNVGGGNFQADVAWRGENRMLARVIVTLGLATADEVTHEFGKRDNEHWERQEAYMARRAEQQ